MSVVRAVPTQSLSESLSVERLSDALGIHNMRANVFTLYEQNIGALTPMLVEELRDALATYPAAWIEDAIRIAVKNNVRRLKYILAVLERMQTEGRYDRADQQTPEDYIKRYEGYRPYLANHEPTLAKRAFTQALEVRRRIQHPGVADTEKWLARLG